jgi:hypothetical protein
MVDEAARPPRPETGTGFCFKGMKKKGISTLNVTFLS